MATLQKVLSEIRELQDEELDLVGGLAGTTTTIETWVWCQIQVQTPQGPQTINVPDEVKTVVTTD